MTDEPLHPAITAGAVAVVTGAASGIGAAAARRFGKAGMTVVLADLPGAALEATAMALNEEGIRALACPTDVQRRDAVDALKRFADALGTVQVVMLNAGREGDGRLFGPEEVWRGILDTNLWGVIHGIRAFVPDLVAGTRPAAVIVTGSKQGITLPPGNTAYNVSKAAVKALTESLAHDLVKATGNRVTAHLLIPGFTFTGLTRARGVTEKPAGAWTADQVVDFMMPAIAAGDFYVLCPDNEVDRATDLKRMRWAMGDIVENRPALSRWHPDHAEAFRRFMNDEG